MEEGQNDNAGADNGVVNVHRWIVNDSDGIVMPGGFNSNEQQLQTAAGTGNLRRVRELLGQGVNVIQGIRTVLWRFIQPLLGDMSESFANFWLRERIRKRE